MIPFRKRLARNVVIELSADGEVAGVSHSAALVTGWKKGDLVSERIMKALEEGLQEIVVEGSHGGEVKLRGYAATDGSGWMLSSAVGSSLDPRLASPVDVQTEADLAYRAFFEQAPIGIVHLSSDGTVTFENHALRRIFGEDPASAWIGRSVFSIEETGRFVRPLIERMLTEGIPFDARESSSTGRGADDPMWLRVAGTPIRDMDGLVSGGVLTVQDVTDLKRAEAVLERDRLRAEADSRMKTELIATLSHELRTPVATIRGYGQLMEEEVAGEEPSEDRLKEFATAVRERASDLECLVGDLIEFTHLEAGLLQLQLASTEVDHLIEEVVSETTKRFDNPVDVLVDVEGGASCRADRTRLKTVLMRILHNALKFTPEGTVNVRVRQDLESVRIEIADSGIGMSADYLARIFDPFSQAEPVLNRRFESFPNT